MASPPVWFERPPLAELRAGIEAKVSVVDELGDARGIVASRWSYDAALMDQAPNLRVISRTGIGYDNVDLRAATERGIVVCNAPDGPTISTAEHAVMLMLAVAKQAARASAALAAGASADAYAQHRAIELAGKRLGLVGYGRIAKRVATMAEAIGMDVLAYDPYVDAASSDLDTVLATADVLSLHAPLDTDTRHMVDAEALAAMRPGAILVNTARGGLVDHDALVAALDAGRLGGAGLDVTEPEPLPPDHPLLSREDVVVTPHIASATVDAKARTLGIAFDQVVQALSGQRPANVLNPEAW